MKIKIGWVVGVSGAALGRRERRNYEKEIGKGRKTTSRDSAGENAARLVGIFKRIVRGITEQAEDEDADLGRAINSPAVIVIVVGCCGGGRRWPLRT